jgi:hypothetical protein
MPSPHTHTLESESLQSVAILQGSLLTFQYINAQGRARSSNLTHMRHPLVAADQNTVWRARDFLHYIVLYEA